MKTSKNIVVIGGGAAGMIASWKAATLGNTVVLLEKNPDPGIKILISGGGKCNITNGSDIRTMLKQFKPNEGRFLKYAFHEFTNTKLLELLNSHGVETYLRENGKVFPVSHNADDVVNAFRQLLTDSGVSLRTQSPVREIFKNPDGSFNIKTSKEILRADKVIVATGGSSYQKTGTTGDGFRWMEKMGHTIVPIRPALTPIVLSPTPPSSWQGTPIRECRLMAVCGNKVISEWNGDVLITHFGISGPAVLEVSRDAFIEFEQNHTVEMCVDFFPELTEEALDEKVIAEIGANPSRSVITLTEQMVPQKLAEYLLVNTSITFLKKLNQLSKTERRALVRMLKRCSLGTVKEIPLDKGEVTAGGVSLSEVETTTMESKLIKNLYLCGEVLDIAGPVGGYNLQAAFSTGYVAGTNAGKND
ncbi:MAG: NAD(P)/FAD-dependent oxidoreductase [Bacteroidota bacterium]